MLLKTPPTPPLLPEAPPTLQLLCETPQPRDCFEKLTGPAQVTALLISQPPREAAHYHRATVPVRPAPCPPHGERLGGAEEGDQEVVHALNGDQSPARS